MLVPAILYRDQIQEEFQKYYYTIDMMYYTGCLENWSPNIEKNPYDQIHQYAIIGNDNKLIGYLSFRIDWYCSRVYNFGLFSFDRGNALVGKAVFEKLDELVNKFHRVEWRAVSGNPACKSYDRFVEKYNGNKHVLKDVIKDRAGNYHDDIIYEIVKGGKDK